MKEFPKLFWISYKSVFLVNMDSFVVVVYERPGTGAIVAVIPHDSGTVIHMLVKIEN